MVYNLFNSKGQTSRIYCLSEVADILTTGQDLIYFFVSLFSIVCSEKKEMEKEKSIVSIFSSS